MENAIIRGRRENDFRISRIQRNCLGWCAGVVRLPRLVRWEQRVLSSEQEGAAQRRIADLLPRRTRHAALSHDTGRYFEGDAGPASERVHPGFCRAETAHASPAWRRWR